MRDQVSAHGQELDGLGDVMEMAASSNKGITFLLMDPDST